VVGSAAGRVAVRRSRLCAAVTGGTNARPHPKLCRHPRVVRARCQEIDSATAPTGERALKAGILMLAKLDDLRDGDKLTVNETR
jgi:hypothetical protein